MDDIPAIFTVITLSIVAIFTYAIIGTLIGLFVSYILSLTPLGQIVENGLVALNFPLAKGHLLDIGATLGFISGLFKGSIHKSQ